MMMMRRNRRIMEKEGTKLEAKDEARAEEEKRRGEGRRGTL